MYILIIFLCLWLSCIESITAQPRLPLDWSAIANRIAQSLALEPNEKVLIVSYPGIFEDLIPHLRYTFIGVGAIDLGVIDVLRKPYPNNWPDTMLKRAIKNSRVSYRTMLRDFDAAVILPGTTPTAPVYAAIQDLLRTGRSRTIHFHWLENGSALPLPGQPLPPPHAIDSTYQWALLKSDCSAIGLIQRRFEAAMRKSEVRVTSSLGTDLRFEIGKRPVNLQDGDASVERTSKAEILVDREIELPCGAIRVSPEEDTVQGTIAFPTSQWNGRPVKGLKFFVENGRIIDITATSGIKSAEAELAEAPKTSHRFREFALGFNPELSVPELSPWIPYYGYGAGVVRLSFGNSSELGGAVDGDYVRWNFFTDTSVTVGDQVWVRDGQLIEH